MAGLLTDQLEKAHERLEEARETIKALCEPVMQPKAQKDYFHYFCGDVADKEAVQNNEPTINLRWDKLIVGWVSLPSVAR